jgi:hypothetical protein
MLCRPELIIQVFLALVFERYDPNFFATSLDEAYLDITEVCIERGITGEEVSLNLPIITTLSRLTYQVHMMIWLDLPSTFLLFFQHASTVITKACFSHRLCFILPFKGCF